MRRFSIFFVLCFFLLPFQETKAQLIVTEAWDLNHWTADSIVRNVLLDQGVTIMNAKFNGSTGVVDCNNIGVFETGANPTNLGIESGVIIASGGVSVAVGPNLYDNYSVSTWCNDYQDADLSSLLNGVMYDVAVLEFDFVPRDVAVSFSFVFGSEEYTEYVGSMFNDVFGFFVDGKNPDGGYYNSQNMALIPGTSEVVSINNVNDGHNSNYYVDNYGGATIQFDGFTTVLEVTFGVVPMTTYHIKMAIADLSDNILDSAVFLEAHSFSSHTSSLLVDGLSASSYPEGFVLCKGAAAQFDLTLNFAPSKTLWEFGDGQTGSGYPLSHTYGTPGDYQVTCKVYTIEAGEEVLASTLTTLIHVKEMSVTELTETHCGPYLWHGSTYTSSGVYEFLEQSEDGCDSLLVLHLTIKDGYSATYNETVCDRYPWPSAPGGYLTSTGHYVYEGMNMEGCDSIVNLNLTVDHTPDLEIHGLTQLAVSSDLWPGVYNYCLADSAELGPCTVTWSCSNPEWIFMTTDDPYWCKLIAKTVGTATLTAVATCDSGCDAEYTLEINASYFDVDENVAEGVSMYPNPAQTQVTVCAPRLTGVGMYDSYGQKVKDLVFDRLDVVTVEVGDLRPGVYLVEIVTATGKTVKRLMINR